MSFSSRSTRLALLAVLAAGVAVYVFVASPPWFERLRYPLDYSAVVRDRHPHLTVVITIDRNT